MASKRKKRQKKAAAQPAKKVQLTTEKANPTTEKTPSSAVQDAAVTQRQLDRVRTAMKAAVRLFGVISWSDFSNWYPTIRQAESLNSRQLTACLQQLQDQWTTAGSASHPDFDPVCFTQVPDPDSYRPMAVLAHAVLPNQEFVASVCALSRQSKQKTGFELALVLKAAEGIIPEAQPYWEQLGSWLVEENLLPTDQLQAWKAQSPDIWQRLQLEDPTVVLQKLCETTPIAFTTLEQGQKLSQLFGNFYLRLPLWSLQGQTPLEVLEQRTTPEPKERSAGTYIVYDLFEHEYDEYHALCEEISNYEITPAQEYHLDQQVNRDTSEFSQMSKVIQRLISPAPDFEAYCGPLVRAYVKDLCDPLRKAIQDAAAASRAQKTPGHSPTMEDLLLRLYRTSKMK